MDIIDMSRHIWVSYMFLNGYNSVTLNQMGLIQDGETVYFLKLLEEKPMSHISFSTTQTAGVQFEASKRRGKGVKSFRRLAESTDRMDWHGTAQISPTWAMYMLLVFISIWIL